MTLKDTFSKPLRIAWIAQERDRRRGCASENMSRGRFVDAKGVEHDLSSPNFEGWLTKQSAWLKDWRRRYFILKGSMLFFSKNEHATPHGMIDLSACQTVKSAELKAGKRNAIEVTTADTTYYMFADSEKEKDEWIGAIGRSIVQASATYTKDDNMHEDSESESEENDY